MSFNVKISTSEHEYVGASYGYITIRTIVAGDTFKLKDELKRRSFRWNDRYGWWVNECSGPNMRAVNKQWTSELAKALSDLGAKVEQGPHTPLRTATKDKSRGLS